MSDFNQACREGMVKFGYDFDSAEEITRLWGIGGRASLECGWTKIPGSENAVLVLWNEKTGDESETDGSTEKFIPQYGPEVDGRGWREIVQLDVAVDCLGVGKEGDAAAKSGCPSEIYLFRRETRQGENWYKFYGVFAQEGEKNLSPESEDGLCTFRRTSTVAVCPRREVVMGEIAEASFRAMKGKVVETNLRDEIGCQISQGRSAEKKVLVWPGEKLKVTDVAADGQSVTCTTRDEAVLSRSRVKKGVEVVFSIPKRDFELGYFKVLAQESLDDQRHD